MQRNKVDHCTHFLQGSLFVKRNKGDSMISALDDILEDYHLYVRVELWCKMRSLQKVVKELEKKNYRYLLDKEHLQKENQQLKEELQKIKTINQLNLLFAVNVTTQCLVR